MYGEEEGTTWAIDLEPLPRQIWVNGGERRAMAASGKRGGLKRKFGGFMEVDAMGIARQWEVEVRVDGETVLSIGSGYLSGVNDLGPYAATIRNCAEHLMAFIGPKGEES